MQRECGRLCGGLGPKRTAEHRSERLRTVEDVQGPRTSSSFHWHSLAAATRVVLYPNAAIISLDAGGTSFAIPRRGFEFVHGSFANRALESIECSFRARLDGF